MKRNIVLEKSYRFALRIVELSLFLSQSKKEFVLSRQLLRSGTSIGANIEEAIGGQSRKDFMMKITIAYKEARETHYWLRILRDSQLLTAAQVEVLLRDCDELLRLLTSIQKTMKNHN